MRLWRNYPFYQIALMCALALVPYLVRGVMRTNVRVLQMGRNTISAGVLGKPILLSVQTSIAGISKTLCLRGSAIRRPKQRHN